MYNTESLIQDRLAGLEAPIRSFGSELGIAWATDGSDQYHVIVPENNPVYPKSSALVGSIVEHLSCIPANSGIPVYIEYASPESGSIGGGLPTHLTSSLTPEVYAKTIAALVYYAGKNQ